MTSELKPCPLTIALFNAADEIDGCGGGNEAEIMRVAANRIMKQRQEIETLNTRAVPDVKELVRYDVQGHGMAHMFDGDYVLHSQAAEIIAAKEAGCAGYREYAAEKSNQVIALQKRSEAGRLPDQIEHNAMPEVRKS